MNPVSVGCPTTHTPTVRPPPLRRSDSTICHKYGVPAMPLCRGHSTLDLAGHRTNGAAEGTPYAIHQRPGYTEREPTDVTTFAVNSGRYDDSSAVVSVLRRLLRHPGRRYRLPVRDCI